MNNDFTISLGRESRIQYTGDHEEQKFSITLADTGLETMTGGRLQRVQKYVADDCFLLTYGDGVGDVDIPPPARVPQEPRAARHRHHLSPRLALRHSRCRRLHQVMNFIEKPKSDAWASAGFFVFERGVFDYLDGDQCVLEKEPLERLAADGQLVAYHHDGFFYAMDTYREYQLLNDLWNSGHAPWKVWK